MLRLTNWYSWSKVNVCVHFRLTKKKTTALRRLASKKTVNNGYPKIQIPQRKSLYE
jgi:hypothetical protein